MSSSDDSSSSVFSIFEFETIKNLPSKFESIKNLPSKLNLEELRKHWKLALLAVGAPLITVGCTYLAWKMLKSEDQDNQNQDNDNAQIETKSSADLKTTESRCPTIKIVEDFLEEKKSAGNEFYDKRKFKEALQEFDEGLKYFKDYSLCDQIRLDPKITTILAKIHSNMAAIYFNMKDFKKVISHTTSALLYDPKYIRARVRRGNASLLLSDDLLEEALEDFYICVYLEKFAPTEYFMQFMQTMQQSVEKEVTEVLKSRKPFQPDFHSIISFLNSFYHDMASRLWKAEGDDFSILFPDGEGLLCPYMMAVKKLINHDFHEIIPLCEKEIKKKDCNHKTDAYFLMATFKTFWGYKTGVMDDFNKVLEDEKATTHQKTSALIKMAIYKANDNIHNTEFLDYFSKAEELDPDNVDIFYQRGYMYELLEDYGNAKINYNTACEKCEEFALPILGKLRVEFMEEAMKNREEFSEILQRINKCKMIHPNFAGFYELHAQILTAQQKYAEAIFQMEKAYKMEPFNTNLCVNIAIIEMKMNPDCHNRVLAFVKESLKKEMRNPHVYDFLGSAYLQLDEIEEGIKWMTKAQQYFKTTEKLKLVTGFLKMAKLHKKSKDIFPGDYFNLFNIGPSPNSEEEVEEQFNNSMQNFFSMARNNLNFF